MSWALIALPNTDPNLVGLALDLLPSLGQRVVTTVHTDAEEGSSSGVTNKVEPERILVEGGPEGLGYHLNRCFEASFRVSEAIEWVLVLNGELHAASAKNICTGISDAIEMRSTVFGSLPELRVSSAKLLEAFNSDRHTLMSSGAGGFMIIRRETWDRVSGFREDMGSWGIDLHFALDALASGQPFRSTKVSAPPVRSANKAGSHIVPTLVAYRTHATGLSAGWRIRFVCRTVFVDTSRSTGSIINDLYRSREVSKTREFLVSGL